jgi:hypothetical protein
MFRTSVNFFTALSALLVNKYRQKGLQNLLRWAEKYLKRPTKLNASLVSRNVGATVATFASLAHLSSKQCVMWHARCQSSFATS